MRIIAYMTPSNVRLRNNLRALKALADMNRLRAAAILAHAGGELCVCEIVDALAQSQYNVSRSLGVLQSAGIIRKRKEGRWAMYAINDGAGPIYELVAGLSNPEPLAGIMAKDIARLKRRLALRRRGVCVVGRC